MGRITVFTESLCSESDNVKYLLDCYELPFVEINLSTHTDRRSDMISLVGDVTTPQIFFNSNHVASNVATLKMILEEWNAQTIYNPLLRFNSEVESAPDPTDEKLRLPQGSMSNRNSLVVKFSPTLITLPNGTSMTKVALLRHLLKILPRHTIDDSTQKHVDAFKGHEAMTLWSQWFHISAKEAADFGKTLLDHGIFQSLCSDSTVFRDMAPYRLQPYETPNALNTFCRANQKESGSQDPVRLIADLCDLMDEVYSDSDSPLNMFKTYAYLNFQEMVAQLQTVSLDRLALPDRTACMLNLYNLMVRHGLLEFQDSNWEENIKDICYIIGGREMRLIDLYQCLLYETTKGAKSKKWTRFFTSCRSPPERLAVDPRIYFCLSWGTKSSPLIRTYHGNFLEQELRTAAEEYCQEFISMDENKEIILLPALFSRHAIDFGGSGSTLIGRLVHYLSSHQCESLQRMHYKQGGSVKVQYSEFDWTKQFGNSYQRSNQITTVSIRSALLSPLEDKLSQASMQYTNDSTLSPLQPTSDVIHHRETMKEHQIIPPRKLSQAIHYSSYNQSRPSSQWSPERKLVAPKCTRIPERGIFHSPSKMSLTSFDEESLYFDLVLPPKHEYQVSTVSALTTDWMVDDDKYRRGTKK